jgi:hypothetical protein
VKWGAIDLNLLVVFDAIMQERSVTRAGGLDWTALGLIAAEEAGLSATLQIAGN